MKYVIVILLFIHSAAYATDDFIVNFSQENCYEDFEDIDTIINITRPKPELLELSIVAALNCAAEVKNVEVLAWRENITLTLKAESSTGWYAACLCMRSINVRITLPEEYTDPINQAKFIYIVKDQRVIGQEEIPNP